MRMSGDRTGEASVTATLSEGTASWLVERAAALGVAPEELLRGILAATRAADEDGVAPATQDDLAALRETVDDLDDDLDRLIGDVRERVVQVKREADAKAPAGHDHPELTERVEAAAAQAEALDESLSALRETVGEFRADVEGGFENYEEVLEYLTDERDRLASDLDALADAVERVRVNVRSLSDRVTTVAGIEHLREEANRAGIRSAACEDCGGDVDVALLTQPACPYCNATFSDVEPRRGFLGNHTLVVGEVPALRAADGPPTGVASTDGGDSERPRGASSASGRDHLDPFGNDD